MTRRVAVVTTSRADYSHLYWVLRDLDDHPAIDLRLIVTGAQLAEEFGAAVREIEADGFDIEDRIECLDEDDTDLGMARTIGAATSGLAESLGRLRPDLLLLIADRYEMLAPASVALALRIPIAHIEGGDVSEGAIDDAVRNALTKMAHLHFTPTETAKRRVIAMGEEPWRVQRSGAPSLDHLLRNTMVERDALECELGVRFRPDSIVVAYHPVTLARDTLCEADALFEALDTLPGQVLFCFPNADAGGRELIRRARAFCAARDEAQLFVNLHPLRYWSLLHQADVMLGNSSSGIMESPSLALPCVNVGRRQQGRERAANILDAEPDAASIVAAVQQARSEAFRRSLAGMVNPYGDGSAARTIVETIAAVELGEKLLIKKAAPL